MTTDRRSFLASASAGALLIGCGAAAHPKAGEDEEVTPAEDLMREHGVLRRVMYIYDEAALRFEQFTEVPLDALRSAAGIIRRVIEDYHEKLEEDLLFPRFEKAGKLADLTAILRRQHVTGRTMTAKITALANGTYAETDRVALAAELRSFNRMYRAHAAHEDTVLFPAIRALVGKSTYAAMGEEFEDKEKTVLGDHGFERAVEDVARLEKAFGIDLAAL